MNRSPGPQTFITCEGYVDWWGLDHLTQYSCAFSPQYFEQSLFKQYQLDCPPDLEGAVEKRKSEFLAGRYCAQKALIQNGWQDFRVSIGPNRNPLWPHGLLGSISHEGQVATAIVGENRQQVGIGIDVAPVVCDGTMNEIKSLVLTDTEYHLFESTAFPNNELFTIIFSFKESFFKAAYRLVNRYFGFDAMSVIAIDWRKRTVLFRLNSTLHGRLREGDVLVGRFRFIEKTLLTTLVLLDR